MKSYTLDQLEPLSMTFHSIHSNILRSPVKFTLWN